MEVKKEAEAAGDKDMVVVVGEEMDGTMEDTEEREDGTSINLNPFPCVNRT